MNLGGQIVLIVTIDNLREWEEELWKKGIGNIGNSPSAVLQWNAIRMEAIIWVKAQWRIICSESLRVMDIISDLKNPICDVTFTNKMSAEAQE